MTSSPRSYVAVVGVLLLAACSGSSGGQGAQGAQGAQGPEGPAGAPGTQGVQGLKGDPAFISSTSVNTGLAAIPVVAATGCTGDTGMEFFGLTADVLQLATDQKIHASATFDLGTTGAGGGNSASGLTLGICYSLVSSGGSVVTLPSAEGHFLGDVDGGLPLTLPGGARLTYSVAKTLDTTSPLANGDKYTVGLCGCVDGASADAANWSPGFGLLTVQVFQPAL